MALRKDALLAATRIMQDVVAAAHRHPPHGRGTVGMVQVFPNSRNVIPGRVKFSIDLRNSTDELVDAMATEVKAFADQVAQEHGVQVHIEMVSSYPAQLFQPECVEAVGRAAAKLGNSNMSAVSGAGYDAVYIGDRSHTAHNLQTVLTPAQETVVVHLRRTLLLPLDDLLAVTREFICPHVSRSGLDRCLRRHGAGNLNALKPQEPAVAHKAFKSYEPGYVHMDVKYLPQMQDESSRRYLFVAIDRATRWVFVQLKTNKTAASAQAFLKALHKACPLKITKLLTDNGKEFTDRLFASREREPSGNHEFDQLCQELGIEHRLTKPRTPRTNGMVERFNGRIADVLKTHRFNSREDMEQTLLRYVALYNHQLPQSALKSKTPMQTMKEWYASHPHLFHKRPYDRPGCDN